MNNNNALKLTDEDSIKLFAGLLKIKIGLEDDVIKKEVNAFFKIKSDSSNIQEVDMNDFLASIDHFAHVFGESGSEYQNNDLYDKLNKLYSALSENNLNEKEKQTTINEVINLVDQAEKFVLETDTQNFIKWAKVFWSDTLVSAGYSTGRDNIDIKQEVYAFFNTDLSDTIENKMGDFLGFVCHLSNFFSENTDYKNDEITKNINEMTEKIIQMKDNNNIDDLKNNMRYLISYISSITTTFFVNQINQIKVQLELKKELASFLKSNLSFSISSAETLVDNFFNLQTLYDIDSEVNIIFEFGNALDKYVKANNEKLNSLEEITLFNNAINKLVYDYEQVRYSHDKEKEKNIASLAQKFVIQMVLKIGKDEKNIDSDGKIICSPMSDEMKNDLQTIFGDLELESLKNADVKSSDWKQIDFFNDFLRCSHNENIVETAINNYVKAFCFKAEPETMDQETIDQIKKSTKSFCEVVNSVLYDYENNNKNLGEDKLGEDNLREIELVRNYLNRKRDQLGKSDNKYNIEAIQNDIREVINELYEQYYLEESDNGEMKIDFYTDYSLVKSNIKILEDEYGMPLDLLLANQDISYLEENESLDVVESDDNKLNGLIESKKEKLSDNEKAEKEREANDLSGFVLKNNHDYNDEISKINLLAKIFVYLDEDDLVDSIGLEKGMYKVGEFVKIFNDSMSVANKKIEESEKKTNSTDDTHIFKEINFFSDELQKASNAKNYKRSSIIWNRLKSIFKLVVTFGISKDAIEGVKQPLLNLRKNAFKQACKDLRNELKENKIIKNKEPEK